MRDRPVPAPALAAQLRKVSDVVPLLAGEGWDAVVHVDSSETADEGAAPVVAPVAPPAAAPRSGLRFVLQVSRFPWGDDPAGWLESVALAADSVGFHGLALMDHLIQIPQVGRAWDPIPEPWVTLGLLAGLPTRLDLGTLVSPASLHLAGRLAKSAATLSALTGGRAFCGVGAGWWEREHHGYGMPFLPPGRRVADLERCLETLRALWRPGTKAYDGSSSSLPETTLYPRPVGDAADRRRRTRTARARARRTAGDACNVPPDPVPQARAVMGDKPVTVLDLPVLGRDREHAAQLVERLRGRTSAASYAAAHPAGIAIDHVARYGALADAGVSTVFVAPPDLAGADEVERFAPVLAAFR